MIFEKLTLHNFGVYKGRIEIELEPKTKQKPIVLFGALNGAGKTTLLDAFRLALYGKFATQSSRGSLSYPDYLAKMVNKVSEPRHGAAVELVFRTRHDGRNESFRLHRSWRANGSPAKEVFEVWRNNTLDKSAAENWESLVDDYIPSSISHLFFFDGEKIERLASVDESRKILSTGLDALLGLELIGRLGEDLKKIERERRKESIKALPNTDLSAMETALESLLKESSVISQERGSTQNAIDQAKARTQQLFENFEKLGGHLLQKRETLILKKKGAELELAALQAQLREIAASAAPLCLVIELIAQAHAQATVEDEWHKNLQFIEMLTKRDRSLSDRLKKSGLSSKQLNVVRNLLKVDRTKRRSTFPPNIYLKCDIESFANVSPKALDVIRKEAARIIKKVAWLRRAVADYEKRLAAVPDPEDLQGINRDLEESRTELTKLERRYAELDKLQLTLAAQIEQLEKEYKKELEIKMESEFQERKATLALDRCQRMQGTLLKYKTSVTYRNLEKLQSLILESFNQLIRKPELLSRIEIDPRTYEMVLYDSFRKSVSPDSLSAGERQLLAVSILWGLAKASGRPLPAIIDTPLGRLDSNHRQNLVTRYFPCASHQVILLSTDEEIVGEYYDSLKPAIGMEYHIVYDNAKGSSEVRPGYLN